MGGEGFVQAFPNLGQQLEGVFMAGGIWWGKQWPSHWDKAEPATIKGEAFLSLLRGSSRARCLQLPRFPPQFSLVPAKSSPLLCCLANRDEHGGSGQGRPGWEPPWGSAGASRRRQPHTQGPKFALHSRKRQFQDPKVSAAARSCKQELPRSCFPMGGAAQRGSSSPRSTAPAAPEGLN